MNTCAKCGGKIILTRSNWIERNGKLYHIKCPKNNILNEMEKEQYKQLFDRIKHHLNINPSDWLKSSGLNFTKVANQIKALKDEGYTYEEQLYALDYLVDKKGQFFGYTHVVNNIQWIIEQKKERDLKLSQAQSMNETKPKVVDLTTLINSEEDEW